MWKNNDFDPFLTFPFIPWPLDVIKMKTATSLKENLAQNLPAACENMSSSDNDEDEARIAGGSEERITSVPNKKKHFPDLEDLTLQNSKACTTITEKYQVPQQEPQFNIFGFPSIDLVQSIHNNSKIQIGREQWKDIGLDAGGEFMSHTKSLTVDQSPYKKVDIAEREKTDLVKVITSACPPAAPPPPIHQVPRLSCSYPPVVCRHDAVHSSSPRQSIHKTSCRGSPCPSRSPCSSPTSSLGDEVSSVPTNPLWTSFRDRYIEEQDDGGTSDASHSLLREIRRLRRMNDEAMSLLTALQTPGLVCDNRPQTSTTPTRSRNPRYLSFKETRFSTSQEHYTDKGIEGIAGGGGAVVLSPEFESLVNRLMDNVTLELNAQIRSKVVTGVIDYLRQNPQLVQQIRKPEVPSVAVSDVNSS